MRKNKLMLICLLAVAFCLVSGNNVLAQSEVVTNKEVIALTKAGLNKTVIVDKIRTSETDFDLSTDALIELKQAEVSDEVVRAMLEAKNGSPIGGGSNASSAPAAGRDAGDPNDPMAPHSYGIYYYEEIGGERKMTQMKPNVTASTRVGGLFTSAMTYGIGKSKMKAKLDGPRADMQVDDSNPVFYFYLDESSGGLNTSSGIPSSPSEFAMVKFHQKKKRREITIGKAGAFSVKSGLSKEYVVEFNAENLGNGIYKVTPAAPLPNGEYAFYLINSGGSNTGAAVGTKFFDFGVKLTP